VVSRNHAVIGVSTREPLAFTLSDLGSSNGTFLNRALLSTRYFCRDCDRKGPCLGLG
jgi:pSer/pThr/pTyr-binding forkhead associated (FHA) protein